MTKRYKNAREYQCPLCNKILFGRKAFYEHKADCVKEHDVKLDSLGRVVNPIAGKHAMESFKKKVDEGLAQFNWTGRHHTVESRKKISEARINYLETHPNHGLKWHTVNGVKVQGSWEKKFAEFLTSKGIIWTRKRIEYCGTHKYTPDFYCPNENVYFEVKGFRRDRDIYKMYLVLREHPDVQIKMIEQEEFDNLEQIDIFKLPNFQEKYKFEDLDCTLFDNVWT